MKNKEILERIEALEQKLEIQLGLLNHMNKIMSDKIVTKIELDLDEAVKKVVTDEDDLTAKNNRTVSVRMDGGLQDEQTSKK